MASKFPGSQLHRDPVGVIKRGLRWDGIKTPEEAIRVIQTVWEEFPQGSIDDLVGPFANRVGMVGDANVRTTQPLISTGKTVVPPEYAQADVQPCA
jgi:hypothetical protein